MELQELLNQIKQSEDSPLEKTAAEKNNSAKERLLKTIDSITHDLHKTASSKDNDNAVESLVKIAQNLANSETEALAKEAEFYGAALADGFLTRLNMYAQNLPQQEAYFNKTAADWQNAFAQGAQAGFNAVLNTPVTDAGMSKTAEDKLAFAQGYNDAQQLMQTPEGLEKAAAFVQGYDEANQMMQTPEGVEKVAAFVQGYDEANQLMQTPDGVEKVAEFVQGYDEANQLMQTPGGVEKVAEFVQGYDDGQALLQKTASAVANTAYKQVMKLVKQK